MSRLAQILSRMKSEEELNDWLQRLSLQDALDVTEGQPEAVRTELLTAWSGVHGVQMLQDWKEGRRIDDAYRIVEHAPLSLGPHTDP